MAIQFQSNLASLSAQRVMFQNIRSQSNVLQQLSTGLRINSADDDAAGLAISERLNSQIRGNKKAAENIQDAYNMLSTVDGFLGQVGDILQRQKELAVQAANDTYGFDQILALQKEFMQNADEIDRMAENFRYNNLLLFKRDSLSNQKNFQVQAGANGSQQDLLDISDVINISLSYTPDDQAGLTAFLNSDFNSVRAHYGKFAFGEYVIIKQDLGLKNYLDAQGITNAYAEGGNSGLLNQLDAASSLIFELRGRVGAHLNRFETALSNLNVQIENQTAAMARYTNTDFAKASIDLTRTQILQQSAAAVLSQANQNQSIALQLIQN
jgi:flagellin